MTCGSMLGGGGGGRKIISIHTLWWNLPLTAEKQSEQRESRRDKLKG